MINVHRRELRARIDEVRPWIERCWSGAEGDVFPRDVIASWRRNPDGVAPDALVPTLTWIGHGPYRFRFLGWDGARWRVSFRGAGFHGWHGFDLSATAEGCTVTHTLSGELSGPMRAAWSALIAPVHDWVIEAMFDRLEAALATGHVPARTTRPMPPRARLALATLRALRLPEARARLELPPQPPSLRDVFLARYFGDDPLV